MQIFSKDNATWSYVRARACAFACMQEGVGKHFTHTVKTVLTAISYSPMHM